MSETFIPYRESVATVLAHFDVDAAHGLSARQARTRLEQYGKNELPRTPPEPEWKKFIAQFQNPLTTLLLAATIVSFVAWLIEQESGLPYETFTILAIVLLNAGLGYAQENRAEHAVAALQAMSAPTARVLRKGAPQIIHANEVVPGDILLLEEGDTLPADARVLESIALRVAESALTGESSAVSKDSDTLANEASVGDQSNMVFSGTAVTAGRGRAIATATGATTEIGKIADTLHTQKEEPTPLQKELNVVGALLGKIVIAIAVLMGLILFIANREARSLNNFIDILLLAVSLAVAAVPEGLTAITTIVLSLGMARMAKRNVIVRKLNAVETLGSTTVICSDKTGTLTKNEITVRAALVPRAHSSTDDATAVEPTPTGSMRLDFTGSGYEPSGEIQVHGVVLTDQAARAQAQRLLRFAVLANNASLREQDGRWTIQGDPTEGALWVAARKAGLDANALQTRYQRIGEAPFSSERKMMSAILTDAQNETRLAVASKGAPDILLARCAAERVGEVEYALTPERRREIQNAIDALAQQALRTLGVAYRYLDRNKITGALIQEPEAELVWLGAVGMMDPPRPEARAAVRRAQAAGVRSIMITGDHPATAAAIGYELGILTPGERAVTGAELQKTNEEHLRELVKRVTVFARVAPEHKLRIVRALKANGAITAMTGDGVNDAPALKASDIGVAMGITGTDVSKGAADMILADDNFSSIVAAVEEGRSIFANIQKFLRYLLSSNIGEVLVMFFGVLLGTRLGLLPEAGSRIIVPLLATQILWINLLTDSGPALALGVEPPDPDVMQKPPRNPKASVITRAMWFDIFFVGVIMMVGTLAVMDASLPNGWIAGANGTMAYAQTMAFTTLVFFQLFNALNARSDELSAFTGLFSNKWLWLAIGVSVLLQGVVIYTPALQTAFSTVALTGADWALCIAVGSTVLWLRELVKIFQRARAKKRVA